MGAAPLTPGVSISVPDLLEARDPAPCASFGGNSTLYYSVRVDTGATLRVRMSVSLDRFMTAQVAVMGGCEGACLATGEREVTYVHRGAPRTLIVAVSVIGAKSPVSRVGVVATVE